MRTKIVLVTAAIAVASLACAARSLGAVTIGLILDQPNNGTAGAGGGATFVQNALPGSVNQSPLDGVVVRYRVQGSQWGDIRLRVLRPVGAGMYDAVGTSETTVVLDPAFDDLVRQFPARVPISVGDQIGIDANSTARLRNNIPGANYGFFSPTLLDSDPPAAPTPGGGASHAILFNADVEPDADTDGFGDETQDLCPADPLIQGFCSRAPPIGSPRIPPPPSRCKAKKKKKKPAGAAKKKKGCKKKKRR